MGVTSYLTWEGEILSETRAGVEADYLPDPLGSTAALLNSSQVKTDTFSWWPFGEQESHSGTSVTRFGYLGTLGYFTNASGLGIYVRARVFSPLFANWVTLDPIWPIERAFSYAGQNPVNFTDPFGLATCRGGKGPCAENRSVKGGCIALFCSGNVAVNMVLQFLGSIEMGGVDKEDFRQILSLYKNLMHLKDIEKQRSGGTSPDECCKKANETKNSQLKFNKDDNLFQLIAKLCASGTVNKRISSQRCRFTTTTQADCNACCDADRTVNNGACRHQCDLAYMYDINGVR